MRVSASKCAVVVYLLLQPVEDYACSLLDASIA